MRFKNKPHLAEVYVCSPSLQQYESSPNTLKKEQKQLLERRLKSKLNFKMSSNHVVGNTPSHQQHDDHQQPQPLPLVELSPFRKSVWRREKSLPDFYERQKGLSSQQQQHSKDGNDKKQFVRNQLVRTLSNGRDKLYQQPVDLTHTEMLARLTAAIHICGPDSTSLNGGSYYQNYHQSNKKNRCCTHPKAEFHHQPMDLWGTQYLIPSFVTRLERTKTSMPSFYRDSSNYTGGGFHPGEGRGGNLARYSSSSSNSSAQSNNGNNITIKGGQMKQQVNKRPLLYLNPLDSYRHSYDRHTYNTVCGTQNPFANYYDVQSHDKVTIRSSFTFDALQARELYGSGHCVKLEPQQQMLQQQATYSFHVPTTCSSPHKFNSKLGAAKSSLEILSSFGPPTKLEQSLVAEYELNLEKFRRDRSVVQPFDLRPIQSHNGYATMNLTRGELCLEEARKANKIRRRKNLLTPLKSKQTLKMDKNLSPTVGGNGNNNVFASGPQKEGHFYVDPDMHPIDSVLVEEIDSHFLAEDDLCPSSNMSAMSVKLTKSALGKNMKLSEVDYRWNEKDMSNANGTFIGKTPHSQLNEILNKNNVEYFENVRKLIRQEDDDSTEISLCDDMDGVCTHCTSNSVSVGRSRTSRAKTNLEYLNKLRSNSVPGSLQSSSCKALDSQSKRTVSLEQSVLNIDPYRGNVSKEKNRIIEETLEFRQYATNHNVVQAEIKGRTNNDNTLQATVSRYSDANGNSFKISNPDSMLEKSGYSSDNGSILNVKNLDRAPKKSQHSISANETDAKFTDCQVDENYHGGKTNKLQQISTRSEKDTSTEDEGFTSPKETEQPREPEPIVHKLISYSANECSSSGKTHNGNREYYIYDPSQTPERLIENSSLVCESGSLVPSILTPQGKTSEDLATAQGTLFLGIDSIACTGIGTPITNPDTSLEPLSEYIAGGHSTNADNEDSGISTTFLTTENSTVEFLEHGLLN